MSYILVEERTRREINGGYDITEWSVYPGPGGHTLVSSDLETFSESIRRYQPKPGVSLRVVCLKHAEIPPIGPIKADLFRFLTYIEHTDLHNSVTAPLREERLRELQDRAAQEVVLQQWRIDMLMQKQSARIERSARTGHVESWEEMHQPPGPMPKSQQARRYRR